MATNAGYVMAESYDGYTTTVGDKRVPARLIYSVRVVFGFPARRGLGF